ALGVPPLLRFISITATPGDALMSNASMRVICRPPTFLLADISASILRILRTQHYRSRRYTSATQTKYLRRRFLYRIAYKVGGYCLRLIPSYARLPYAFNKLES